MANSNTNTLATSLSVLIYLRISYINAPYPNPHCVCNLLREVDVAKDGEVQLEGQNEERGGVEKSE